MLRAARPTQAVAATVSMAALVRALVDGDDPAIRAEVDVEQPLAAFAAATPSNKPAASSVRETMGLRWEVMMTPMWVRCQVSARSGTETPRL